MLDGRTSLPKKIVEFEIVCKVNKILCLYSLCGQFNFQSFDVLTSFSRLTSCRI